jgi:hypothetical protein
MFQARYEWQAGRKGIKRKININVKDDSGT